MNGESDDDGQVVSSEIELLYSMAFPGLLVVAAGAASIVAFHEGPWPWLLPAAIFMIAAVATRGWFARFARRVVLYPDRMEITDRRGQVITVRPDELARVSVSPFTSPEIALLSLRRPGGPDAVRFVAPLRFMPFGIHPVEARLDAWRTHGVMSKPRVE